MYNNKIKLSLLFSSLVGVLLITGCASTGVKDSHYDPNLVGINAHNINGNNSTNNYNKKYNNYVPGDNAYWNGNSAPSNLNRNQIMASNLKDWTEKGENSIRLHAIKVAAVSLGSQAGLLERTKQIRKALMAKAKVYDKAFNFKKIMLQPGLLPPVIIEGRNSYHQENPNVARSSDYIFKIIRPARIVSAPPTWRTYLLSDYVPPARPKSSVLPENDLEKKIWNHWANEGWVEGVQLANQNFKANLARLRQSFEGMIRYKILYEQGLVSKPMISRSNLGVTGGGNEMAINDRIIKITRKAMLDANKKNWSTNKPKTSYKDIKNIK